MHVKKEVPSMLKMKDKLYSDQLKRIKVVQNLSKSRVYPLHLLMVLNIFSIFLHNVEEQDWASLVSYNKVLYS